MSLFLLIFFIFQTERHQRRIYFWLRPHQSTLKTHKYEKTNSFHHKNKEYLYLCDVYNVNAFIFICQKIPKIKKMKGNAYTSFVEGKLCPPTQNPIRNPTIRQQPCETRSLTDPSVNPKKKFKERNVCIFWYENCWKFDKKKKTEAVHIFVHVN